MTEVYITGHSLGAARAALYAYYRVMFDLPVAGLYLFGCPNPGNRQLGKVLSPVPTYSFKNRRDLVTDVPVDIELLGEEYVQVAPFLEINEPPPKQGDPWGIFADHHSELYQAGMKKFPQPFKTVTPQDAIDAIIDLYNNVGTWSWTNFVNSQYWACKDINGAKLLISRGTTTSADWLSDFEAYQISVYGARVSDGFWDGVGPILQKLDNAVT